MNRMHCTCNTPEIEWVATCTWESGNSMHGTLNVKLWEMNLVNHFYIIMIIIISIYKFDMQISRIQITIWNKFLN